MDHLLTLLTVENAKVMRFQAGSPPVIVSENERRTLQGPPVKDQEVVQLLRSLASSRQIRNLRDGGTVEFVYTRRGRSPFLVRAKMENGNVVFDVS